MRYKEFLVTLFISFVFSSCNALGISSKLDFGESSSKLIGTATQYKSHVPLHNRAFKRDETSDFEGIGVVCTSGGCNKTESKNESKDSIQTDVVVHVKTNVDLNSNKSDNRNFVDDTPDVPVVVGLAGTSLDNTGRNFNQRPTISTDFEDSFSPPSSTPTFGSSWSSTFRPSTPPFTHTPSLYGQSPSYISAYNPSTLSPGSVYVRKPTVEVEPQVDINIKSIPGLSFTMTSDDGRHIKDFRYKTNGIELRVPYFESSYHNHYFGEHPPPQIVWYPKTTSSLNPVEFRNVPKSPWKPSLWYNTGITHKHSGADDKCQCKNQPRTGLQWYPNRKSYSGDPGTQINDKLAPLN